MKPRPPRAVCCARLFGETRVYAQNLEFRESRFRFLPQARTASSKNGFAYDEFALGKTIYLYVEATPFTDVDETGERRRGGRQKAIDRIRNDPNTPRCIKGWFQQEENHKKRGGRGKYKTKYMRLPPSYDLAHPYGKESCKGCDYSECCLQNKNNHKTQTKMQHKKGIFK